MLTFFTNPSPPQGLWESRRGREVCAGAGWDGGGRGHCAVGTAPNHVEMHLQRHKEVFSHQLSSGSKTEKCSTPCPNPLNMVSVQSSPLAVLQYSCWVSPCPSIRRWLSALLCPVLSGRTSFLLCGLEDVLCFVVSLSFERYKVQWQKLSYSIGHAFYRFVKDLLYTFVAFSCHGNDLGARGNSL